MKTLNRLNHLPNAFESCAPKTTKPSITEALKDWEVGLRDGGIRLLKFFRFDEGAQSGEFESRLGHFMCCSNLVVSVHPVAEMPHVMVEIQLRPEYETASVAAEIASECERLAAEVKSALRRETAA